MLRSPAHFTACYANCIARSAALIGNGGNGAVAAHKEITESIGVNGLFSRGGQSQILEIRDPKLEHRCFLFLYPQSIPCLDDLIEVAKSYGQFPSSSKKGEFAELCNYTLKACSIQFQILILKWSCNISRIPYLGIGPAPERTSICAVKGKRKLKRRQLKKERKNALPWPLRPRPSVRPSWGGSPRGCASGPARPGIVVAAVAAAPEFLGLGNLRNSSGKQLSSQLPLPVSQVVTQGGRKEKRDSSDEDKIRPICLTKLIPPTTSSSLTYDTRERDRPLIFCQLFTKMLSLHDGLHDCPAHPIPSIHSSCSSVWRSVGACYEISSRTWSDDVCETPILASNFSSSNHVVKHSRIHCSAHL